MAEERQDHKSHMNHAFGSIAILQTIDFSSVPSGFALLFQFFIYFENKFKLAKYSFSVQICRVFQLFKIQPVFMYQLQLSIV